MRRAKEMNGWDNVSLKLARMYEMTHYFILVCPYVDMLGLDDGVHCDLIIFNVHKLSKS